MAAKAFYNFGYRFFRMPWEIGARSELVDLVSSGRLLPGRAIDLGCGTGANAIYLAQQGFDVTGVDFAPSGLAKAARSASAAGVKAKFVQADLTALPPGLGTFDLLVDYGTLDDLGAADRDRYVANVSRLGLPGTQFLLWCFEWHRRWRDRLTGMPTMEPGEVESRFRDHFAFERLGGSSHPGRFIAGTAVYLGQKR